MVASAGGAHLPVTLLLLGALLRLPPDRLTNFFLFRPL